MVSENVVYICGPEGRNYLLPLTTLDQGSQNLDFQRQPGPGQSSYRLSAGGNAMKGKGECVFVCVHVHTCTESHASPYAKDSNQVALTSLPCVGKRVRERRHQ